jgi:hypothetical protein
MAGWDRIFKQQKVKAIASVNWVVGKTIPQIRAIQACAHKTGMFCEDIVKDPELWLPFMNKPNLLIAHQ